MDGQRARVAQARRDSLVSSATAGSTGRSLPMCGVASTREWVQVMREDPADFAKDMDLVQQSLEYVKTGRR